MADTTTTNYGFTKPEVGASGDTWGGKQNSDLDLLDAILSRIAFESESTVASGSTADIGDTTFGRVVITGTTTITSFGPTANRFRIVRFAAALTLDYNATSLITLTGANRSVQAGDVGAYASDNSGNWREIFYSKAGQKNSFLSAYVTSTSGSVTGDGTAYNVTGWTEELDSASAFNASTGVWTAPTAGVLQISGALTVTNPSFTSSIGGLSIGVSINGGSVLKIGYCNPTGGSVPVLGTISLPFNYQYNAAAGDTLTFYVTQTGGTKVTEVQGGVGGASRISAVFFPAT